MERMSIGRLMNIPDNNLTGYGQLVYAMGKGWKKPSMCNLGLRARAEGLISQNPKRNCRRLCTVPEISGI